MIKAAYFPTIIYAKDVNLDNRLFERDRLLNGLKKIMVLKELI